MEELQIQIIREGISKYMVIEEGRIILELEERCK